jgi:hypothetical protein
MTEDLEALSSEELHDRAVSYAKRHLDVKFFWNLMKLLPAAEASVGDIEQAEDEVQSLVAHVDDLTDSGKGEVADALRPYYLEYLVKHQA